MCCIGRPTSVAIRLKSFFGGERETADAQAAVDHDYGQLDAAEQVD
jgi:hypothetical protein